MLWIFLWAMLAITAFMIIFGLTMHWAVRYVTSYIESRQRAVECIIDRGSVPDAWARPFRRRMAAIQAKGGSAQQLERVGRRAQARFLQQIDSLARYFRQGGTFDTAETRRILLEALQERREEWAAEHWQSLLGLETGRQG